MELTSQFKWSELLNFISIGVLVQLMVLFELNYIFPIQAGLLLDGVFKSDSVKLFLILALSLPVSRGVSNCVEFIMDSRGKKIHEQKHIQNKLKAIGDKLLIVYRSIFFGLQRNKGINHGKFFSRIFKHSSISANTLNNIKVIFNIEIDRKSKQQAKNVFYLMKSYCSLNSATVDLYSTRYNIVLNYHARLAIIAHLATHLCLLTILHDLLACPGNNNWMLSALGIVVTIWASRHFAKSCILFGKREEELLVYDFNAIASSKRAEASDKT